jgi:diguanylate cyclase (GGDEF)-like protein
LDNLYGVWFKPIREKFLRFRNLQTRIIVAFAALLFIVQLAVLVIINGILSNSANQEIEKSLATGNHLYDFINEEYSQRLTQAASILSSDFAFREAIATADRETVLSALANHGARFKADAMFLANTDHHMIADTLGLTKPDDPFPFPEQLISAEKEGKATAIVFLNGHLYRIVVVPVLAPAPIAWLASGFIIDDKFARNLQSLMGLEVSFLSRQQATGQWRRLATSLPAIPSESLPGALSGVTADSGKNVIKLQLEDNNYLALTRVLASNSDILIVAVLQRSFREVLEPLSHLQQLILMLSGVSFLAALMASTWIARSITTPIRTLGALAQRIEYGDYSQPLSLDRHDEIGQLASAFNHMSEGIADRETKIMELANHDPLTGLPNRTLFHDRLHQAIKATKRGGQQVTVMIMDLDRFKEVNDIMGHHVGDLLLQEVARRLQTIVLRDYDTVARLGGDEFAILLATDLEGAQIVANNLLRTIDQPILLEGQEIIVSASIGITCYPEHGDEINTLLRHADLAMYAAKNSNAGYVTFDPSLDYQGHQHLSLMVELRRAIAQDELTLFYQPKIELVTGVVSHVEALVRWIHPERGLVPPGDFIPYAENTGFIKSITQWVIEQALRQQKEWQKAGVALTVSINISAHDLFIPKLPEFFAKLMETYAVSPHCMVLEITESAIMADPQRALGILNELHDMGLRLSIDDFGTGYSSLAYLKKLPVSELKIDKSFVTNMENDRDDAIIVHSTIDLAHNMGLTVVAEGVENLATLEMLQSLGCDFLQGYYISRPLPVGALLQWVEKSSWKLNKVV